MQNIPKGKGLGKTQSIVLGNHRDQCACVSRVARHRLAHATIIAQNMPLSGQQTYPDLAGQMRRQIRRETVVTQYNDADRFLHDTAYIKSKKISNDQERIQADPTSALKTKSEITKYKN